MAHVRASLGTLAWGLSISLAMVWAAGVHQIPLSRRADVRFEGGPKRAIHVLVSDCDCSAAVSEYLAARGPRRGWSESVWVVGGGAAWTERLREAGFDVDRDGQNRAAAARIAGGPMMLAVAESGQIAWLGGYTQGAPRRGAQFRDIEVLRDLEAGREPSSQAAIGCPRANRTVPR